MNKTYWIAYTLIWTACAALPGTASAQSNEEITLKRAITLALDNSPDLALARARQAVAKSTTDVSRSAFGPNLYTGSGAAYTYGFPQTPSGAAPSIVNLSYLQTLFNPVLHSQTLEAGDRDDIQRLEFDKARNAVVLQTTSSYLELAKVRHSLEVTRQERQSAQRIVDFTSERAKAGLEKPIEVTRAELAAATIERNIRQLESRQQTLEVQLAAVMGLPKTSRFELDPDGLAINEEPREQDLIQRALETNQDIREAEYEKRAKEHRLAGEIGGKWPTVDLVGEYGLFSKVNNFQDYFKTFQRNNFTVGVQVKIPILSADHSSKVSLARSEVSVAEMELKKKRQDLELEVERQYQHLRQLDADRDVARLERELAQENVKELQEGFDQGRVNLRDMEKARIEENDKWMAFLNSDFEHQKSWLELLNITGELSRLFEQKP
jgi:outer membrane protein TolC